jgi:Uma2 family endonuclease
VASGTTRLMTVADLGQFAEPDGCYYELHHGEAVKVTRPVYGHFLVQQRIAKLLTDAAAGAGFAYPEVAFRALPEYELRVADVAYAPRAHWERTDLADHFRGAPEIVVEVLSPSNTVAEMNEKAELCLKNGAREFWLVDPVRREVKVSTASGRTVTFRSGQQIPLAFGGSLAVDAIFSHSSP